MKEVGTPKAASELSEEVITMKQRSFHRNRAKQGFGVGAWKWQPQNAQRVELSKGLVGWRIIRILLWGVLEPWR